MIGQFTDQFILILPSHCNTYSFAVFAAALFQHEQAQNPDVLTYLLLYNYVIIHSGYNDNFILTDNKCFNYQDLHNLS